MTAGVDMVRRMPVTTLVWGVAAAVFAGLFVSTMGPLVLGAVATHLKVADEARHPTFLGGLSDGLTDIFAVPFLLASFAFLSSTLFVVWAPVGAVFECAVYRKAPPALTVRRRFGAVAGKLALLRGGIALVSAIALWIWAFVSMLFADAVFWVHGQIVVGDWAAVAMFTLGALAVAWLYFKLALLGPMVAADDSLDLGAAWRAGHGHDLELLVVAAGVAGMVVTLAALGVLLTLATMGWGLVSVGGESQAVRLLDPPARLEAAVGLQFLVSGAVVALLGGPALMMMTAPWARAYADLTAARSMPAAGG